MSKSELSGDLLDQQKSATLGDTLSQIPSLSSSFFGSSASRPQIRGQGGHRVVISSNGMPIRDMSAVSDDQLVPIEPFFADTITVLKGARASIPYGGEAMAGLVDVEDGRIPLQLGKIGQDKVEVKTGYNTATSLLGRFQGEQEGFAYNLNILHRERGDYKVPDTSKSPLCNNWSELVLNSQLVSECQVSLSKPIWEYNGTKYVDVTPVEQQTITHELANSKHKVDNSSTYQTNFTLGGSQTFQNEQLFGLSVNFNRANRANRAIPGFVQPESQAHSHALTLDNQSGNIRIYSSQYRFDGLYKKDFSNYEYLNQFDIKGVYSKQYDDEMLDGSTVNEFVLSNWQLKPTLNYQLGERFSGSLGISIESIDKQGSGKNNYLPHIRSKREAAYMLQDAELGPLSFQLGARYEHVEHKLDLDGDYQVGRGQGADVQNTEFELFDYSSSLTWDVTSFWFMNASYTYAERAPDSNELYASNPHYALLIEEQGDSSLNKEINKAYEYGTGLNFESFNISANWYENNYENFIYLGSTGISRGDVYLKDWRQADTLNKGFEIEMSYALLTNQLGNFTFSAYADQTENTPVYQFDGSYDPFTIDAFLNPDEEQEQEYFRRKLEGQSILKTPADSIGAAIHWQFGEVKAAIDYKHSKRQDKLAKSEMLSQSYDLIGADISIEQSLLGFDSELFINIDNLTNQDVRPHQSYLRHLAPLPGRSIAIGIRAKI